VYLPAGIFVGFPQVPLQYLNPCYALALLKDSFPTSQLFKKEISAHGILFFLTLLSFHYPSKIYLQIGNPVSRNC